MSVDILDTMMRDENSMERMAAAFETIADTVVAMYKLQEQRFDKEYPSKPTPKDATVTRIASDEDKLREDLGDTGEPLEDWVGPRERELQKSKKSPEREDRTSEIGSAGKVKDKS